MKSRIVVILGPTGVGKTAIAMDLGREMGGEIINADSQQIYRYMDIGTGKPSIEQRRKIAHHLIDVADPDDDFDAARFRGQASTCVAEIRSRRKRVIVCGGTGLYIRALIHGLFSAPAGDLTIRSRLNREAEAKGLPSLYERLSRVDPDAAARIHPNDRQRVIRALEVFALTEKPISRWQKEHGFQESPFETLKIGLNRERKELYDLIERRCDEMIAKGIVEEVRGLVGRGYSLDLKALQSIGYRQIGLYLSGVMDLDDALSDMKRETRRLAKRQLTWFRSDRDVRWFHPEKERGEIVAVVQRFLS